MLTLNQDLQLEPKRLKQKGSCNILQDPLVELS